MKNVSPTKEEFTTDNRKEEIGKKLELEMKLHPGDIQPSVEGAEDFFC